VIKNKLNGVITLRPNGINTMNPCHLVINPQQPITIQNHLQEMDPSEYKKRIEVEQQKLKRHLEERYEYNVQAAEKAKKEILERRLLVLGELIKSNLIKSIREDEAAGKLESDHADEQCNLLSFASYGDVCMDYPRNEKCL